MNKKCCWRHEAFGSISSLMLRSLPFCSSSQRAARTFTCKRAPQRVYSAQPMKSGQTSGSYIEAECSTIILIERQLCHLLFFDCRVLEGNKNWNKTKIHLVRAEVVTVKGETVTCRTKFRTEPNIAMLHTRKHIIFLKNIITIL